MTNAKSCLIPADVTCPPALPLECGTHCDFNLNIGIFFDGTDNNLKRDIGSRAQSNVARLFSAYRDSPNEGFFAHYIPGVGTKAIDEFGTSGEDPRESAAGKGGEPRIIHGLLQVLNSVNRFVNKEVLFDVDQMRVLCSDRWVAPENSNEWPRPSTPKEDQILTALGLESGLVDHERNRTNFLKQCASKLSRELKTPDKLPRVAGVYIDVFGFSRGSAQARVFTNWLHQYFLIDGKLFGIPSFVRMLGIMDTVASVGSTNATWGQGHWSWATPENLQIHKDVKNCVHYVALHEFRTVFPSDSICRDNILPENCHEHYYPGAHSDVGGGYPPGCQGKAVKVNYGDGNSGAVVPEADDSKKLSQMALNDMYLAARKTCEFHSLGQAWKEVTPQSDQDQNPLIEQFAMDPQVRTSVESYFAHCTIAQDLPVDEQLRKHGLLYLTWRYQVNAANYFEQLTSVKYAHTLDTGGIGFYRQGQEIFAKQVKLLSRWATYGNDKEELGGYNRHAGEIYKLIVKMNLPPNVGGFYDSMVHDSYAAFIQKVGSLRSVVEGQGYMRYRGVYRGNETRLNAMADTPKQNYA
ncbi:T6SS phospholipase effector Tle1-like catalytic domain-containing protein [Collimonas pratensis]|uniref:T6SS Phospholipase effector Tle1-like catalytic domain-containing protein n=1 Tax=Collimonas pratensis TaxID=279113 RepID=A0ABN4M7G3_9BURK|nr:DUF2235 domain-containing protein [Collimonas pratensis]AMP13367.1 hypothetical protein CPter291_1090 [Collimonas pratensis]